ncbi:MAG: CocE/NonD family hydrolase, partial [Rhodospirillales bacterium]|nr:CocE/NonD family hydrolase [Rhodospirillales bacterium]
KELLLPFHDHYLKGLETDWEARPGVEYFVRGADVFRTAESWPPENVSYKSWYLGAGETGSVTSLNDGSLTQTQSDGPGETSYTYPDPGWNLGVVGMGPNAQPDPARRVLTFTTDPLAADLEIAGPIKLVLHTSSTNTGMDFFVKLSEQMPQAPEDREKGLNPAYFWITKGWLRASHRVLDEAKSMEMEPYYSHGEPEPVEPGKIYRLEISIEPMAHRFQAGNRMRLEIVNGDSAVTDVLWTHYFNPDKIGTDTIYHLEEYASELILPVTEGG